MTFPMRSLTKYALLLILLSTALIVSAQKNEIDSLRQQIVTTVNKSDLLVLYQALSKAYDEAGEARSLKKTAIQLQALANELNKAEAKSFARYYIVRADFLANKTDQLLPALNDIIVNAEALKLNLLLENAYRLKAQLLRKRGDLDSAILYYQKTLAMPGIAEDIKAYTYGLLANAYESKGDYKKALESLNNIYEYVKSKNDPTSELMFNQNMGLVYLRIKQPAKARTYFEKNLQYLRKIKSYRNEAISLTNIGHTYFDEKNYEKALEFYEAALELDKTNGVLADRHHRLMNVANARKELKTAVKTETLLDTARAMAEKVEDIEAVLEINNSLSRMYLEEKNYEKALPILLQSKEICKKLKRRENLLNVYRGLALVYEKTGPPELAYEAHRNVYAIRDSLYNENALKQFQELQTRYETSKKEQEIALLEKNDRIRNLEYRQLLIDKQTQQQAAELLDLKQEDQIKQLQIIELQKTNENISKAREIEALARENQDKDLQLDKQKLLLRNKDLEVQRQNFLIGAIVLLAGIFSTIGYLLYSRSRLKMKNNAMLLEQKLLRSQMNPHFIFNSLASIQGFLIENEPKKTANYLTKFSKLMRQTLENSREDSITLSKEIQLLENYLQLQELRFVNKFKWEITVSPEINPNETLIPPMFAQPFIENSLEHGILHNAAQGMINISFTVQENKLLLMVTDNGGGISQGLLTRTELKKEYKSLATQITQERLSLLRQKYKQSFDLVMQELTNEQGHVIGTQVQISLPY
ncbi:MAG: tetratricopeptide repeat protein [Cytophagia bacterium]|nr:tetratricopeptide repeat protein [Cytophagia bacterium]